MKPDIVNFLDSQYKEHKFDLSKYDFFWNVIESIDFENSKFNVPEIKIKLMKTYSQKELEVLREEYWNLIDILELAFNTKIFPYINLDSFYDNLDHFIVYVLLLGKDKTKGLINRSNEDWEEIREKVDKKNITFNQIYPLEEIIPNVEEVEYFINRDQERKEVLEEHMEKLKILEKISELSKEYIKEVNQHSLYFSKIYEQMLNNELDSIDKKEYESKHKDYLKLTNIAEVAISLKTQTDINEASNYLVGYDFINLITDYLKEKNAGGAYVKVNMN